MAEDRRPDNGGDRREVGEINEGAAPGRALAAVDPEPGQPAREAGAPLPPGAAAVLAQWATSDVPAGFVDRVVAATHGGRTVAPRRRHRWSIAAPVVAAALLGVAASLVVWRGSGGAPEAGARIAQLRETIAIGGRGVAVAEAGAELAWTVSDGGAAEVHQTSGDVFYRVENGGPFVVDTPAGQIIVRGTCFRVEVQNMRIPRTTWISGAVGAAVAATVVIAVYEGGVRVVNARGRLDARPGEQIVLRDGAAPARVAPGSAETAVAAIDPPPPDSATVSELRRRDQSHRGEIAQLRARLRAAETAAAATPAAAVAPAARDGGMKIVDLSQDELVAMAKRCEIRFDIPGYGIEPRMMTDKMASTEQLSSDDRAIYDRSVRQESERYMASLRALYRELTGAEGGDALDAHSLAMEVLQKSPQGDVIAARKRIAEERAGLAAAPADARGQTVIERMFRLQTAAGDTLERMLAADLGADKAHQLRVDSWAGGDTNIIGSCED
jgi:hypothetical protein